MRLLIALTVLTMSTFALSLGSKFIFEDEIFFGSLGQPVLRSNTGNIRLRLNGVADTVEQSIDGVSWDAVGGAEYPVGTNGQVLVYNDAETDNVEFVDSIGVILEDAPLRKVIARQSLSQNLLDDVITTIVFDIEVSDVDNLYDNTTGVFTCPEAGVVFSVGYNVYQKNLSTSGAILSFNSITNGSDVFEMSRTNGIVSGNANITTPPFMFTCASSSETWEFQSTCNDTDASCDTRASSGATSYSHLSIIEVPPTVNLISKTAKCQNKFLSATISTNITDLSDLRFNNLTIGQRYKICTRIRGRATASADNFAIDSVHDGSVVFNNIISSSTANDYLKLHSGCSTFTATATTLTHDSVSVVTGNNIDGDGTKATTYARLCTDNSEETTEFN